LNQVVSNGETSVCFKCNDGSWETGEQCDNAGTETDGCLNDCTIDPSFVCHLGFELDQAIDTQVSSICFSCNDASWETGEECDNGGTDTDGCHDDCSKESTFTCTGTIDTGSASQCNYCGNSLYESPEECDGGEGCTANCLCDLPWTSGSADDCSCPDDGVVNTYTTNADPTLATCVPLSCG